MLCYIRRVRTFNCTHLRGQSYGVDWLVVRTDLAIVHFDGHFTVLGWHVVWKDFLKDLIRPGPNPSIDPLVHLTRRGLDGVRSIIFYRTVVSTSCSSIRFVFAYIASPVNPYNILIACYVVPRSPTDAILFTVPRFIRNVAPALAAIIVFCPAAPTSDPRASLALAFVSPATSW